MAYRPPKSPMGNHIQVCVSFGNVWATLMTQKVGWATFPYLQ